MTRPKLIAEIAQGYEGNPKLAELLLKAAIGAGADAVKFQLVFADELATPGYEHYALFQQLEMDFEVWADLRSAAAAAQRGFYLDIYGTKSLAWAKELEATGVKLSTTDFYNKHLLELAFASFDSVILSSGGIPWSDLEETLDALDSGQRSKLTLTYGFQAEPTLIGDNNLNRLSVLKESFPGVRIGFMDHSDGETEESLQLPILAAGIGVDAIEKHITLDHLLAIEDHVSALTPSGFKQLVSTLDHLCQAFGKREWELTDKEKAYAGKAGKVVVCTRPLARDTKISAEDVALKRVPNPSGERTFRSLDDVIGKTLARDLELHAPVERIIPMKRKLVATLACRNQGSRLYGKPLQNLDIDRGLTILEYMVDWIREIPQIDEIVLGISEGTDNLPFVDFCDRHEIKHVIGDQKDVLSRLIACGDHAKGTDVFRVTTESPFTHFEMIAECWQTHLAKGNDMTSVDEVPDGANFEIIKLDALKRAHRDGEDRHRSELCVLYIRENPDKFGIEILEPARELRRRELRLTVDYPEDLILCRAVYQHFKPNFPIPLAEIIKFLDENPFYKKLTEAL